MGDLQQALARVIVLDPERISIGAPMAPLNRLDKAAVALCNAAWEAGAVVGDAFARAERSLESERRICPSRDGDGQRPGKAQARFVNAGVACLSCGGRGTVPFGGGA